MDEEKKQNLSFNIMIIVAIFLVSLGITLLSKINKGNGEIVSEETNNLRDKLYSETSKVKELSEEMQKKQKELNELSLKVGKNSEENEKIRKEIEENNKKSGIMALKGEGVVITLKDRR